jgi:uncharacterized integral membrane protein
LEETAQAFECCPDFLILERHAVFVKSFRLLLAALAASVLVALAVANRQIVPLILDPFKPEAPAYQLELPLYTYLIGALIAGVVLGGAATWLSQGRWRRASRHNTAEALRWRSEADRLSRERDAGVSAGAKALLSDERRTAA